MTRLRESTPRRAPVVLTALLALNAARAPHPAPQPQAATVGGVVYDSVARAPLAGAVVQLVAEASVSGHARTAVADSAGRFAFDTVPAGRYTVGFFHPRLDALGIESPLRPVVVASGRAARAELAIPGTTRLRAAICGARDKADSDAGIVVGVVRDPGDGSAVGGVTVSAQWVELALAKSGVARRVDGRSVESSASGWFALCDVPRDGMIQLLARRGADSLLTLEFAIPKDGVLARDLYLAPASGPAVASGTLRGVVVAAAGGRPLAGARVRLVDGPETVADDRGSWSLTAAPLGTRVLEVRAVGYYPDREPVDLLPNAPSVRVALPTLRAVLDTVRIAAARIVDRRRSGFADRQRTGAGRYITAEQIARRNPLDTKDLFRIAAGVTLMRDSAGATHFVMRSDSGWCEPAVFVDGQHFRGILADDVDVMILPKQLMGVEYYTRVAVPPQFIDLMNQCGVIAFWTK